jgi:hypothetical protein
MESSNQNKRLIFDEVRHKWVAATPEEMVRQGLLKKMVNELSFPRELIAVEKNLSEMPHLSHLHTCSLPTRRMDIVCFGKGIHSKFSLYPLLVIECKESEKDKSDAMHQVMGYNHYLQACFLAVAHPGGIEVGYRKPGEPHYEFLSHLPSFAELLGAVKP